MSYIDLLCFTNTNKRITFSPSLGIIDKNNIKNIEQVKKELNQFNYLCTREKEGTSIINDILQTERAITTLDPTLLVNVDKWFELSRESNLKVSRKYVLVYFLKCDDRNIYRKIDDFAKENDFVIIDLLNKDSSFYNSGPSEFLFLIKNADYIFTDSFHGVIFSILFEKKFYVFKRGNNDLMYSRISNILSILEISNVEYDGEIIFTNKPDYIEVNKKLSREKNKTLEFLKMQFNK